MGKTLIWSGSHSIEIKVLIKEVCSNPDLFLILCPPRIKVEDLTLYYPFLPKDEVEFHGDFSGINCFKNDQGMDYSVPPRFALFSTGTSDLNPKLIFYTLENLTESINGIFSFFKDLEIKTIFSYPRPYHVFGLALGYVAAELKNLELIVSEGVYSSKDHLKWQETTNKFGRNLLTLGTPTHFLDAGSLNKINSSLTCIIGGARVDQKIWDYAQTKLLIKMPSIGYGCSETSPGVTHLSPGIRPLFDGDIGKLLPNTWLEGDLFNGANVCQAIVQNEKIFYPNGKYELGDVLTLTNNGNYHFQNRKNFYLNRGGEKFSLEEIEHKLKASLGVDCIAVVVKNDRLGEDLGIISTINCEKILNALKEIYGHNFSSSLICQIDKIPVNENAKFDRRKCLELLTTSL
jgi:acyl-CoA synthetase (AMP-forming)/AMP-acid ligase II